MPHWFEPYPLWLKVVLSLVFGGVVIWEIVHASIRSNPR